MKIKVTLRKKSISNGKQSLYLDFYPAIIHPDTNQETRREFLKMHILEKPRKAIDKKNNEETLNIAELIRQKRESLLNRPEIYTEFEKQEFERQEKGKQNFLVFYDKQVQKRKGSSNQNWITSKKHFENYIDQKKELPFNQINEEFCNNYRDYLLSAKSLGRIGELSNNTAFSYFNKFLSVIREAFKYGYLQIDLVQKVDKIKEQETKRQYLTIEELNALVNVECESENLRNTALFSALTGLRSSDIKKLIWAEVEHTEQSGYFLRFRQKKTQGMETLPISEQAFKLMGERKEPTVKVFKSNKSIFTENKLLKKWIKKAGITKDITFHCFRHTYATLQLTNGTDIYTVSKMLGHKDLKTTQIYAKIVDEKKREATNKIKLDF